MKNMPLDKTYGHRLERYKVCVFAANLCGAGLLGLVSCGAAGAIGDAPSFLQSLFFLSICVGGLMAGWCRFYGENKAGEIQRLIDLGQISENNSLPAAEMQMTPSVYSCFLSCLAAVVLPAAALLCGVWIPLAEAADPKSVLEDAFVLGVICPLSGVLASKILSRQRTQVNLDNRPDHLAQCARLLTTYEELARRAKMLGFALLGQIACVAAGAFVGVSGFYQAALFSAILFSGHNFCFHRVLCELAAQQIRRDLKDGVVQNASEPQFAHAVYLVMLDQNVFLFSALAAPLILFAGVCTSLFSPPFYYTTAYLSSISVGVSIFGCFKSWWKLRQFNMLWAVHYREA